MFETPGLFETPPRRSAPAVEPAGLSAAILEYLATLTITQGRLAGELFHVLPWERRFVRRAFAPEVETAALSVARGNGKTALVAGIACSALDGPLAVPRGETIIVAGSFEQARVAFDHIVAFMRDKLAGKGQWRVWDSPQSARIENRRNGARLRCIASDPRRAHGLAPVLVLADEPAQWPETTGERMRAAMLTGLGKVPNGRFVALGTRPAATEHWFAKMLAGGADYAQNHAAAPDDPPFRKATIRKANPSLDHMPDLERTIRREAEAAKRDPSVLPAYRALRLNGGTSDTEQRTLLDAGTWERIEGEAACEGPAVWGIDLGTSAAMSAVAAFYPATGALVAMAAFPREPSLAERGLRDGVGNLYALCAEAGELLQNGGEAVDIRSLIEDALARFGPPSMIAVDRWREKELRDALDAAGCPLAPLHVRGQGFKDGGEDVRGFRRACLEGRVVPRRSLLMRAAMAEARTVPDPAGNEKLAKGGEGGRRQRARDDAAAAAILAVALGVRAGKQPARRPLRTAIVT